MVKKWLTKKVFPIWGEGYSIQSNSQRSSERLLFRAFFESISKNFGIRGESGIMKKLPIKKTQWKKHYKKDQITANRIAFFFFYEEGTVWPRNVYNLLSKSDSRGQIPGAIPLFLLRKNINNTVIRFPVVWSFLLCFWHCLILIGNFVMVDSPRSPISSGIDLMKPLCFFWTELNWT